MKNRVEVTIFLASSKPPISFTENFDWQNLLIPAFQEKPLDLENMVQLPTHTLDSRNDELINHGGGVL